MNNKGTQALLKSDVEVIKDIVKRDVSFSFSTTDVEGVRRLFNDSNCVFPPIIDIPYEVADSYAKKLGFVRGSLRYKAFAFASLFFMFVQMFLSVISAVLVRAGLKPLYRSALFRAIKDCDVVVSYSDENFKEGVSMLPSNVYWVLTWWTLLLSRTWDVLTSKFLRKSVVMLPNSIGSFRTWIGRLLARLALNSCDRILIREPRSFKTVESLGIKVPKILAADTTLLLNAEEPFTESLQHPVLGVSVGVYSHSLPYREVKKFIEVISRALDSVVEKYGFSMVFLPHYVSGFPLDDLDVSRLIISSMRNKDRAKLVNTSSVDEYKAILSEVDMVISSKMHPAVLAVASYVPAMYIVYDNKQLGFFEQLGMVDCTLPITEVSIESLQSKIEYVWGMRDEIRAKLKILIPILQAKIKGAVGQALSPYVN
jgi:polysaccharide pyruvyl transferase WcaK-like protein